MTKLIVSEAQKAESLKRLQTLVKPTTKIVVVMHSVSASGMSRKMSAFVVHKGELVNLNFDLEKVCPRLFRCTNHPNRHMTVKGCGMDMTFWLADAIKGTLYSKAKCTQSFQAIY